MAKKTVKRDVVVTPNPNDVKTGISFEDLSEGEYFIMDGDLWQKSDDSLTCQRAQNVSGGEQREDLCKEKVIPVTVVITWTTK